MLINLHTNIQIIYMQFERPIDTRVCISINFSDVDNNAEVDHFETHEEGNVFAIDFI